MKGDFSRYSYRPTDNHSGVLQQQGRVLTDQDWNASTAIESALRSLLGRDTIGAGVVAVPAELPLSLRIVSASSDGSSVSVEIEPGRAWLDGIALQLGGESSLNLEARYLEPPLQLVTAASSIAAGVRDAVVLELWEEAESAFQDPEHLIEPALGGPDTTERVRVAWTLRLLRLAEGEECFELAGRLRDDWDAKGHLTVAPAPTLAIGGDCPVQFEGGYTGLEHYFYRIEIVDPDASGQARFAWSRFNGGLVGRGVFDSAASELHVRSNDQMINHSGLTEFYLEVVARGPATDPGRTRVTMTAQATLVSDGRLALTDVVGSWPGAASDEAFFRLWDGVRLVSAFPTGLASNAPLENGLLLAFDPPVADGSNYRRGDYWTFAVRASGIEFDPAQWPNDSPPEGVRMHRAPLGVLEWDAGPVASLSAPDGIHDCRRVFQPLTRVQSCCTYRVGDGRSSVGDFDTIAEAIAHLPSSGGEICVLPGSYEENVVIEKSNVHIHGCGSRTLVGAAADAASQPVFTIRGAANVRIDRLACVAGETGIGVLVEADARGRGSREITLAELELYAAADSAIKVLAATGVRIERCEVNMADVPSPWPAVFLAADQVLFEHNRLRVASGKRAFREMDAAGALSHGLSQPALDQLPGLDVPRARAGRGGVQLAGGCEDVRVIDNQILGGIGQGITLGSLVAVDETGEERPGKVGWVIDQDDPCEPCRPGGGNVPPGSGTPDDPSYHSAGALYEIRIERNRIQGMGLAGIGVVGFFDLREADEFISVVGLDVLGNELRGCLWRELQAIPQELRDSSGYGAITLADVELLRLYDNQIEGNGPNHLMPVCGVFVLHGEGLDISRNRIRDNGQKTEEGARDAIPGARAGVFVAFAMPVVAPLLYQRELHPRQAGVPALRVHDNVVSQPLGQALFATALGPCSVQGNSLTSRGVVPSGDVLGLLASTVGMLNLGLSNELYLQLGLFTGPTADPETFAATPSIEDGFLVRPDEGLDDRRLGTYLANGNVQFTDNQVVTDWMEGSVSFALSAVTLLSLDDVQFMDNQLDADFLVDLLFTHALVLGMSVRITDNRIKESLVFALFSSVGLGLFFNHTTDNQCTHCVLSLESPLAGGSFFDPGLVERDNMVLFDWFSEEFCGRITEPLRGILSGKGGKS